MMSQRLNHCNKLIFICSFYPEMSLRFRPVEKEDPKIQSLRPVPDFHELTAMNYLAHAYLSFQQPEILLGNMISDFVKGKKKFDYPATVQTGIALHRAIDTFTDEHPLIADAKEIFRPVYRLYSGAMVDVVLDHFVATDPLHFSDKSLLSFSETTYRLLALHQQWFPEKFERMFPYMVQHNWLYNYQHKWGIEKSLGGVVRRAVYLNDSAPAYELFETHFETLQKLYNEFFPLLYNFASNKLKALQTEPSD
jgi:acyl carrier protein phosphodiesterase